MVCFVGVEHRVGGSVADGMDRRGYPGLAGLSHHLLQFLLRHHHYAQVIRLTLVRFQHGRCARTQRPVGKHLQHGRCARTQRPVGKHLYRPDAEHFVSKATPQAQLDGGVQIFQGDVHQHPQPQLT